MTGQDYVNNKALHPFWDASRDPNKEDVADAYEQGKADGWKEFEKQKQDAPEGLEEAAFTYENDLWESGFKDCGYSPQEVNDAFKAGAKWQAEQGESYTAEVIMLPVGIKKIQHTVEGFEPGDKVIVQIRKK